MEDGGWKMAGEVTGAEWRVAGGERARMFRLNVAKSPCSKAIVARGHLAVRRRALIFRENPAAAAWKFPVQILPESFPPAPVLDPALAVPRR